MSIHNFNRFGGATIRKIKLPHLILFIVYVALMLMGTAAVFVFSANYQQIYGTPKNTNAVVNFAGFTGLELQSTDPNLSGEWEFFYNRWIVSDSDTNPRDGMVQLPGRWTGKELNGQKLPNTGYASYRLTIVNLKGVENAVVHFMSPNIAYRAYVNGILTTESGKMSKDINLSGGSNTRKIVNAYNPSDDETLTVVVEISANSQGGMISAPLLIIRPQLTPVPAYEFLVFSLPVLLAGGMFVAFLFCAFAPVRTMRNENRLTFTLLVLLMLLHYLTTKDATVITVDIFKLNSTLLPVLRYISALLMAVMYVLYLRLSKVIALNKRESIVVFTVNAVAFAAYFALTGWVYQIIPIALSLATLFWVAYKIMLNEKNSGYFFAFLTINLFMFTALLFEALDSQGLLSFGFETVFSLGMFLILIAVVFLNFYKLRESEKMLLKAVQTQAEVANMKKQALKEQIKPHFIFNALSSIKEIYRKDSAEGEEMLTRFAQHLRANVDSDDKELIPFEEELGNMLNYFELENLRSEKKLNLILNVEFTDFSVPVLSLQPLLENAVKYAGTQEMENGYIQISSSLSGDDTIVVEVADNGRGFDPDKVRAGAVGLKNTTKRLEYALNATVTVNSSFGAGTTVAILIPRR